MLKGFPALILKMHCLQTHTKINELIAVAVKRCDKIFLTASHMYKKAAKPGFKRKCIVFIYLFFYKDNTFRYNMKITFNSAVKASNSRIVNK